MNNELMIGLALFGLGICIIYFIKYCELQNKITEIQDERIIIANKRIDLLREQLLSSVKVKIINKSGFPLPKYETNGAAGFDIRAVISEKESTGGTIINPTEELSLILRPGEQYNFDTGLYIEVPEGYEIDVRGRSGLAFKHGIGIVHGVGTIDSDYRGEIRVCLINHSNKDFIVKHGDRIAQGLLIPVIQAEFIEVEELSESDRGQGGFGSTGV